MRAPWLPRVPAMSNWVCHCGAALEVFCVDGTGPGCIVDAPLPRFLELDLVQALAHETSNGVSGKVLAPGHGFNSERSQRAENGGRP